MDHLQRLIRLTLWFLVGMAFAYAAIVPAHAQQTIPATLETVPQTSGFRTSERSTACGVIPEGPVVATKAEACAALPISDLDKRAREYAGNCGATAFGGSPASVGGANQTQCVFEIYANGAPWGLTLDGPGLVAAGGCPSGYTQVGSQCQRYVCPAGYTGPNALNQCTQVVQCPAAGLGGTWDGSEDAVQFPNVPRAVWDAYPRESGTGCNGFCEYRFRRTAWISGTMFVDVISTGASCSGVSQAQWPQGSPGGPTPTPDPATECLRNGGMPGTFNGAFRCASQGETQNGIRFGNPTTSTTTRTNPDGSTTTETTTQTPRTECAGGQCTTTTTTTTAITNTPAGGGPGTTTTSTTTTTGPGTGGQQGDCDPRTQRCGEGGRFGGSCGAGFVCDGDAVQCAMAREQYIRNCQVLEPRGSFVGAELEAEGDKARAGTGTGSDFIPRREVESPTVATAARLNAGACPSPQSINTPIGAVTVDLTNLCDPMRWFGLIIVGAALLVAARIIIGGI